MKRAEELKSLLKPQAGADCDTEDIGIFQHINMLLCTHLLILKIQYLLSQVDFFQLVKYF